ncbi:MAG TPA: metal-dependent transcriptional regulator [Planctomycetes bacterium]|nr:metal-dependent transcriptional regulator [Planctomycetota bacterium]HIN80091.1 metal-dependent transcriptional regulator [Planctomycetota bacterium]
MISESSENYLKAIFKLQRDQEWVATGEVARRVGVAPPSATRMIQRLGERGWVEHGAYRGVRLTDEGRRRALKVVRSHRILETYLAEVLGMPWDRVHSEVERLEHVVSEDLVNRLEEALGFPIEDPHGSPIPDRDGHLPEEDNAQPLSSSEVGRTYLVRRISDAPAGALQYLGSHGIVPGVTLVLEKREPFEGPLLLKVGGDSSSREGVPLGRELARRILVEPQGGASDHEEESPSS